MFYCLPYGDDQLISNVGGDCIKQYHVGSQLVGGANIRGESEKFIFLAYLLKLLVYVRMYVRVRTTTHTYRITLLFIMYRTSKVE
jgi:hypothetical protein